MSPDPASARPATTDGGRTVRAVLQDRYGGPEVLRLGTVPRPEVDRRQVLVQVQAAGIDRGTEHLMEGTPYAARLAFGLRRPRNPVPGRDVAGTVVEVGPGVTRFAPGDEVFGTALGSLAELAVAKEDKLARMPAGCSFAGAAVIPVSGGTALQALVDAGRVQPGQSVLVLGASGGVGSFAVQLATAFGAEVTGVCSAAKVDFVRSLGADRVLAHEHDDWAAGRPGYDLVLDIGGNPPLARLRRALAPRGTVVFVGAEARGLTGLGRQLRGSLLVSPFVRQRLALLVAKERAADFARLAELVEAGRLRPPLERTYPLEETATAMRRLQAGEVRGKVAVIL